MRPLQSRIILSHKSEAQRYLQSLWSYLSIWPLKTLRFILDKDRRNPLVVKPPLLKVYNRKLPLFLSYSSTKLCSMGCLFRHFYYLFSCPCIHASIHPSISFQFISLYSLKRSHLGPSVASSWVGKWVLVAGLHLQIGCSNYKENHVSEWSTVV